MNTFQLQWLLLNVYYFCFLIVYLRSPTRWMPWAVPLLLLMRQCFSTPTLKSKCKTHFLWMILRREQVSYWLIWTIYSLWSLEDIHFKPQSWCSLLFGFSLADVMCQNMLNGKVSKMSSLIEEAFKLVPFPNLATNKNGWAAFSLNTVNLKADLNLVCWWWINYIFVKIK